MLRKVLFEVKFLVQSEIIEENSYSDRFLKSKFLYKVKFQINFLVQTELLY